MSTTQNLKELYCEYVEVVWNQKNLAALDNYFSLDFIDHTAPPGTPPGLEGTHQLFAMLQTAFPDYRVTVGLQVAEGDFLVSRLLERGTQRSTLFGIPATGREITLTSTRIVRERDGKFVEHWGNSDELGLMQQLGAIQILGH